MKARLLTACVLVGCFSLIGCAGEAAEEAPSTTETTNSLLTTPVGDGRSTPIAADPSLVQDGPRVRVSDIGFNRGDTAAILKVVELSDFGCGFCRQFHGESFDMIREEFIDTGMIEWKFVPYITGMFENSLPVTEAGECVMEQDDVAYEELAFALWQFQADWKSSDDAAALVREWVTELDIDMDSYDSCLAEDRRLPRIAQATTLARQIGVRGTPTFVVVGWPPIQGAIPPEAFRDIFNALYSEQEKIYADEPVEGDTGN